MHSTISRLTLASVLLWGAACSDRATTKPIVTTAGIFASATPAAVSVVQGATGTAAIAVARINFAGDIQLTAEGVPSGVTATFTPSTLGAGVVTSSLALEASGTTAVTTTSVTVRARGTGVADATTPVSLTVTTAAINPAVTLGVAPATASIVAGQGATASVAITRSTGYTGGVNMSVTGAPTGMTTAFSSANPIAAATVNLSVTTLTSVVPGQYTLTARANAAGLTEATATYVVTVAAPPTNRITWRFCNPDLAPIWFAYLDGSDGTWQAATAVGGVYDFGVGQPQVGVAFVRTQQGRTVTEIRYYALAEVAAAAAAECVANPVIGTKTLTGFIAGFATPDELATLSLGGVSSSVTNSGTPAFTISRVVDGALDLIAVRADIATTSLQRVVITRGVNAANGSSLGTIDLAGGTSFAPATGSVTVTTPNDGTITGRNLFTTATRSSAVFSTTLLSSGLPTSYQGVPVERMLATDLQQIQATQEVGTTLTRFIARYTRGPTSVSMAMPADPGSPVIATVSGAPYARASVSAVVPQPAFNDRFVITFDQQARARRWVITSTTASRVNSGAFAFTMPDFSSVNGWQNSWALGSGVAELGSSFSGRTGAAIDGSPITGTTAYTISRQSTFAFP